MTTSLYPCLLLTRPVFRDEHDKHDEETDQWREIDETSPRHGAAEPEKPHGQKGESDYQQDIALSPSKREFHGALLADSTFFRVVPHVRRHGCGKKIRMESRSSLFGSARTSGIARMHIRDSDPKQTALFNHRRWKNGG
jgi:hypothetical protein